MSGEPPAVRNFVLNSDKITKYLLVPTHPRNQGKAAFFLGFGFGVDRPDLFARALLSHAVPQNFKSAAFDAIGACRLIYEGPLDAPDGRRPGIRTVWQLNEDAVASFVTSFPRPRHQQR